MVSSRSPAPIRPGSGSRTARRRVAAGRQARPARHGDQADRRARRRRCSRTSATPGRRTSSWRASRASSSERPRLRRSSREAATANRRSGCSTFFFDGPPWRGGCTSSRRSDRVAAPCRGRAGAALLEPDAVPPRPARRQVLGAAGSTPRQPAATVRRRVAGLPARGGWQRACATRAGDVRVPRPAADRSRAMPIDDATIEWDEARAPFERVATITIPAQRFDVAGADGCSPSRSRTRRGTPCRPTSRSAESTARAASCYETVSRVRHELNGSAARAADARSRRVLSTGGADPASAGKTIMKWLFRIAGRAPVRGPGGGRRLPGERRARAGTARRAAAAGARRRSHNGLT